MSVKPARKGSSLPENAIAKTALDAITKIEEEAQAKKMAQLETLTTARGNVKDRIEELEHQLQQIENAIAAIKGEKAAPGGKEKRTRRNLDGERERVARWMEGRRGQKFAAGDLVREFPELDGTPISIFLRPLVESGKIHTDASDGIRRMKYFIA